MAEGTEVAVEAFHEDRDDAARRAMPRLAVGTSVVCALLWAVVALPTDDAPKVNLALLCASVAALSLLLRFDVYRLRSGPRVRYELSTESFSAYRGDKEVFRLALKDIAEWKPGAAADTLDFWTGLFWHAQGTHLSCSFRVGATADSFGRWVQPPPLFRWADRGGLQDVNEALQRRLGKPWNGY